MRVNQPEYRFYRTTEGYFVEALENARALYWITQIKNGHAEPENQLEYTLVNSEEISQITFPEEGSYIVKIQGVIDGQPASAKVSYYIRYYPTLKERLIANIRALVCDCSSGTDLCAEGQYNLSQRSKNDIYLGIVSIIGYKDILTSPCFSKCTEFALRVLLGETIDKYVDKLTTYMDFIDNYGYSPDTELLVRELMSLIYVTAYFAEISEIEFDYVAEGAEQGNNNYNDGEATAIEALFNFADLEACYYSKFGININEFIAKFEDAFENSSYACVTGASEFLFNEVIVDEIIIPDPIGEIDPDIGGQTLSIKFSPTTSSLVFVNGQLTPASDYVVSGSTITFKYPLSSNDRITVVK